MTSKNAHLWLWPLLLLFLPSWMFVVLLCFDDASFFANDPKALAFAQEQFWAGINPWNILSDWIVGIISRMKFAPLLTTGGLFILLLTLRQWFRVPSLASGFMLFLVFGLAGPSGFLAYIPLLCLRAA